ncbi:MAG: MmcQ/YjbR family DNA-binding protein [Pseudomonadota bacterium]|nr:MmcQ/YjbR family DNA-binding protein [Pseudomonadota bacterium]
MTIEENIFKRAEINKNALAGYGFRHAKGFWILERPFMNGDFKAVIRIDSAGRFSGTVYEIATEDEYLPLRVESMDGFAAEVRNAYIEILKDIKEKSCHENVFIFPQTNRLADEIYKKYGDKPEFPWPEYPTFGVFKNPNNGKWYALVMALNVQKVDKKLTGEVEVMNIKLDPEKIKELHKEKGFYPAYHMNKKNWISILLNDTVPDKVLLDLLDESHRFTIKKQKVIKHN